MCGRFTTRLTCRARIDHAAGAQEVGLALPSTLLPVFGNAKVGTLLMKADPRIDIDVQLKMLAWQDSPGLNVVVLQ